MHALFSVFGIILLGLVLRRLNFVNQSFWDQAEKTTYFVFFPALLASNLATAELSGPSAASSTLGMALAPVLAVLVLSALILALRPLLRMPGPAFSSVFQGSVRLNTFIGLAYAEALFGAQGLALSALVLLPLIPMVNLLCVPVVRYFSENGEGPKNNGVGRIALDLLCNPLILGVLAGFLLNLSGLPLPKPLLQFAELLGRAALPMGLLAVGAGLRKPNLSDQAWPLALSLIFGLLCLPALCLLFLGLLGVHGPEGAIALLFSALPTAPSAYILARQLGGDEKLMAAIITLGIAAALLTMPIWLHLV